MSKTVLSVGLEIVTGWALRWSGYDIVSGVEDLRSRRTESDGMPYLRFRRWLSGAKRLAGGNIDLVVYGSKVRATRVYYGFEAMLMAWCEHHGIPYRGMPGGLFKKHATGKYNASNVALMKAIRRRHILSPATDSEAEALALMYLVIDHEYDDLSN